MRASGAWATLAPHAVSVFSQIVVMFLDWLSGSANCEDPQFQGLVDEIRGRTGA